MRVIPVPSALGGLYAEVARGPEALFSAGFLDACPDAIREAPVPPPAGVEAPLSAVGTGSGPGPGPVDFRMALVSTVSLDLPNQHPTVVLREVELPRRQLTFSIGMLP